MSRRPPYTETRVETAQPAVAPQERDLSICAECASRLVEPFEWSAAGAERWRVVLRCPNCEHRSEGVFTQACVDRFDEELDRGTGSLCQDLKRLEHANMIDDVERFIGALHADAILPEDF
jgi:hypothetical protein